MHYKNNNNNKQHQKRTISGERKKFFWLLSNKMFSCVYNVRSFFSLQLCYRSSFVAIISNNRFMYTYVMCEWWNKIEMNFENERKKNSDLKTKNTKTCHRMKESEWNKRSGGIKTKSIYTKHTQTQRRLGIIKTNQHNLIKSNEHFSSSCVNLFEWKECFSWMDKR